MISIGESEFSLKVTSSLPLPSQSLLVSYSLSSGKYHLESLCTQKQ